MNKLLHITRQMPAKDWFTLEVGEYHIWCAFVCVCVYVRAKKGRGCWWFSKRVRYLLI